MHSSMALHSAARTPRLEQRLAAGWNLSSCSRQELRPTLSIIRTAIESRVLARALQRASA